MPHTFDACASSGHSPRLVVRLELLDVAEDLDEEVLLRHAHVAAQVAAEPVAEGPPREPAAVLGEVVERDPQLTPVDHLEGEMVQVRRSPCRRRRGRGGRR